MQTTDLSLMSASMRCTSDSDERYSCDSLRAISFLWTHQVDKRLERIPSQ
jgi:hypothetical protein